VREDEQHSLARFEQATAAHAAGDTRSALQLIDTLLAELADNSRLRLFALIQKAGWLRESGSPAEAVRIIDIVVESLNALPAAGYETEWSSVRLEQGIHARERGDFETAEQMFIDAEALAEKSPAADLELPDIYSNRAGLYMDQGRYGEALDSLTAALAIDRRVDNLRSVSNDLNMLGMVYQRLGDTDTATAYLEEAFDIAASNQLAHEAYEAMSNLTTLIDDAGDHARAAGIFAQLGLVAGEGGDAASFACTVANQGVAAALSGNFEEAAALFTRSHELHLRSGNPLHAVQDLLNVSGVYAQLGDPGRALALSEKALAETQQYGLVSRLWMAEYTVAGCRLDLVAADPEGAGGLHQIEEALAGYKRAADIVELLRDRVDRPEERELLLVGKEAIYERAIMLCLGLGRAREAFRLSERARMRSFLEALGSARLERIEHDDPATAERSQVIQQLHDPGVRPDKKPALIADLRRLRAEMIARRPATAAITEAELPSEEDICAAIPPETHLLEFFQLGNSVVIFLVNQEGLQACVTTKFEDPIQSVVEQFRAEIESGDAELATGNVLFAALIRPVMPHLATCGQLIVVPHGVLHYIPFCALWFVPAGIDAPPRQYLRNRFHLTTAPSASYLPHLANAGSAGSDDTAVVLGNPTGDLSGAEAEATTIAHTLGVVAKLGPEATRAAFLNAGSPAVLHVATHGQYNATDPLLSDLRFADGSVTVEELLDSGPSPRLLVLSGCVTGISKRRPGDELLGLAQAALRRGTQSVVATLWETFDESSAVFFDHFYQALVSGSTVLHALGWAREQIATGPDGFDHPVDWAPFLLIGDPDTRIVTPEEDGMTDFDRGAQLAQQGDVEGAKAAYQAAINTGSPREAALARYGIGMLMEDQGDAEGAMDAYQSVIRTADPTIAPLAIWAVARLIEPTDRGQAKTLYRQAMSSSNPEASPNAALDLGYLLLEEGDIHGAEACFEKAMYSTHPTAAGKGAANLGTVRIQQGDVEGAKLAYQRAIDVGEAEVAARASRQLASLEGPPQTSLLGRLRKRR